MEFGDYLNDPKPCCVRLRCKSLYTRADERPGLIHHEEAMDYWCGHTNRPIGPDKGDVVHPLCQPGRSCYKSRTRSGRNET